MAKRCRKGKRCFSINGFSLHANTAPRTHQRKQLAKLIEYISRGPLSNERLEITEAGSVKLQLKTRFSDGTTHLLFTPSEFIEKLCALIPPSKLHLVKWSGVFAPNHPLRSQIILKPQNKRGMDFSSGVEHQGVDYEPPPRAPPRVSSRELEFEGDSHSEDLPELQLD